MATAAASACMLLFVAAASRRASASTFSQLDVLALNSTVAEMRRDEARITHLIAKRGCTHVYLDIGSNLGVQIRKLFEPRKYAASPRGAATVLPIFDELFGVAPRCHVCAIGMEPNPHHRPRLQHLKRVLTNAGAAVEIFEAAAGHTDGLLTLKFKSRTSVFHDAGLLTVASQSDSNRSTAVRMIHLARIIKHVRAQLGSSGVILMKLDIEGSFARTRRSRPYLRCCLLCAGKPHARSAPGTSARAVCVAAGAEWTVLPDLLVSGALCAVNRVFIEYREPPCPAQPPGDSARVSLKDVVRTRDSPPLRAASDDTTWGPLSPTHKPHEKVEEAGLHLMGGFLRPIRETIRAQIDRPACPVRMIDVDDETFVHDGQPWPSGSVCHSRALPPRTNVG